MRKLEIGVGVEGEWGDGIGNQVRGPHDRNVDMSHMRFNVNFEDLWLPSLGW